MVQNSGHLLGEGLENRIVACFDENLFDYGAQFYE